MNTEKNDKSYSEMFVDYYSKTYNYVYENSFYFWVFGAILIFVVLIALIIIRQSRTNDDELLLKLQEEEQELQDKLKRDMEFIDSLKNYFLIYLVVSSAIITIEYNAVVKVVTPPRSHDYSREYVYTLINNFLAAVPGSSTLGNLNKPGSIENPSHLNERVAEDNKDFSKAIKTSGWIVPTWLKTNHDAVKSWAQELAAEIVANQTHFNNASTANIDSGTDAMVTALKSLGAADGEIQKEANKIKNAELANGALNGVTDQTKQALWYLVEGLRLQQQIDNATKPLQYKTTDSTPVTALHWLTTGHYDNGNTNPYGSGNPSLVQSAALVDYKLKQGNDTTMPQQKDLVLSANDGAKESVKSWKSWDDAKNKAYQAEMAKSFVGTAFGKDTNGKKILEQQGVSNYGLRKKNDQVYLFGTDFMSGFNKKDGFTVNFEKALKDFLNLVTLPANVILYGPAWMYDELKVEVESVTDTMPTVEKTAATDSNTDSN
jgi:hypothetical protein